MAGENHAWTAIKLENRHWNAPGQSSGANRSWPTRLGNDASFVCFFLSVLFVMPAAGHVPQQACMQTTPNRHKTNRSIPDRRCKTSSNNDATPRNSEKQHTVLSHRRLNRPAVGFRPTTRRWTPHGAFGPLFPQTMIKRFISSIVSAVLPPEKVEALQHVAQASVEEEAAVEQCEVLMARLTKLAKELGKPTLSVSGLQRALAAVKAPIAEPTAARIEVQALQEVGESTSVTTSYVNRCE
jgi:hypothetical protein